MQTNQCFDAFTWTGATNTNWFDGNNWTPAGVPTLTSLAVVPVTATRWPIVTGTAQAYNLTIQAGAVLTISNGASLVADGEIVNNGALAQIKDAPNGATTEFLHIINAAGTIDQYHGIDITPTGGALGATTVQIKGNQTACTTAPADPILHRCYRIDPTTPAAAAIKFWFTEAERNSQAANSLKLWHWSPWAQVGTNYVHSETTVACLSGGGLACWFQADGISAYSPFALGSSTTPTAIQLRSFDARGGNTVPWLPLGACLLIGSVVLVAIKRRR